MKEQGFLDISKEYEIEYELVVDFYNNYVHGDESLFFEKLEHYRNKKPNTQ